MRGEILYLIFLSKWSRQTTHYKLPELKAEAILAMYDRINDNAATVGFLGPTETTRILARRRSMVGVRGTMFSGSIQHAKPREVEENTEEDNKYEYI